MGERAAPDPLFLPGPLISGGASFCLSPGPPFRSPRPPLPSSPQSLKGPGHTEVSGVRTPFTSSGSRRCSSSLGSGPRSCLLGGGGCVAGGISRLPGPGCPLPDEAQEGQPKPRVACSLQAMPSPVDPHGEVWGHLAGAPVIPLYGGVCLLMSFVWGCTSSSIICLCLCLVY